MGRPNKNPGDRLNKRLTMYLTSFEEEQLNLLSTSTETEKTKIVRQALKAYFKSLKNPPQELRMASHVKIMEQESEQVNGYICALGHPIWLESTWPSPPIMCPCCGSKDIRNIWGGIIKKGF